MLAYWAKDIAPENAKGHPRLARLMTAGPWSYKAHPNGGTLAYLGPAMPFPKLQDYGAPRDCPDGLMYYPPRVLPALADLARPAAKRPDVAWVPLACGQSAAILPSYLEPRRVLMNGEYGDPVTDYGKQARKVDELMIATPEADGFPLLHPELLTLCRMALRMTYPLTDELIDDLGVFTNGDIDPIAMAAFHGPKAVPASEP